ALRADVEIAAAKRDHDAAGGNEERHRPAQAALPGARIEKGAVRDAQEHFDGGEADRLENHAAERERERDESERASDRGDVPPHGQRAPVMAAPTSLNRYGGLNSATIRPDSITTSRSLISNSSSRSEEIRRTPHPRAVASRNDFHTKAVAPTSRPRVGCAAMTSFASRSTSRAR